jgi:hypothetical protein
MPKENIFLLSDLNIFSILYLKYVYINNCNEFNMKYLVAFLLIFVCFCIAIYYYAIYSSQQTLTCPPPFPKGCDSENKMKFTDFEKKMNILPLITSTKPIKKISLFVIDESPIKKDSSGIHIVTKNKKLMILDNDGIYHADYTVQTIKKYAKSIVDITHICSQSPTANNDDVGYLDVLKRYIGKPEYQGAIIFFIMNEKNSGFPSPIEGNKTVYATIQNAIKNNMVVIQSSGNDAVAIKNVPDTLKTNSLIVGGAEEKGSLYNKTKCTNYGERIDVYGPSCVEPYPNKLFCQSSSGSSIITALAVNLQYECSKSKHKFLTSKEMQDIFRNAPSDLKLVDQVNKKIPQYDKLLKYAQEKYFSKSR